MLSIKGTFENGVARPEQRVDGREGQNVLITFVEVGQSDSHDPDGPWASLSDLIDACQVETGISDLAHQHDHYIHGTPKRD